MRRRAPAFALALAIAVAGCAIESRTTYPPIGSTPQPVGDATDATKQAVIGALAAVGLQASDAIRPHRPFEGPLLAAAPRSVLQVTMPDDPDHGFVDVYAFDSPNAALAAANDQASWVAGTGKMNFTHGTRFVLRVLGATVIWYAWTPGASPDARAEQIGPALGTIGEGVAVNA